MKKSLVALAVLAAAGAASAQSSVTLFGVVDAAISNYSVKSSFYNNTGFLVIPPAVQPLGTKRSQWAMSNGANSSSRLGFRGTEDLGGGLAASFWLEAGLANDQGTGNLGTAGTGNANSFGFNRRSTVSLSGGFGEVRLGRDYTPTFWNDTVFDPFGTVGVGTNLVTRVAQNVATARGPGSNISTTDTAVRSSNSVGYFLPPNLGGFYGQAMYALPETVKTDGLAGTPSKRGQYVGGRFGYANGPLDVAVAYGESTAADLTGVTAAGFATGVDFKNKIKTANLGASYDFGVVKVLGEISRVTDKAQATAPVLGLGSLTTSDSDKYTGALLGVVVPVGPGQIKATYSRVKFKNDVTALGTTFFSTPDQNSTANQIAVGYVHNLSKRTALYATAARIRIKNGENNPAIMGAVTGGSPSYLSTGAGTVGYAPRTATGYDFGIRHSF